MSDQPQPSPNPVEIKTDQFREVYANFSRVAMSPWDLGVLFGTLGDAVPGHPNTINAEVLVRMSPQQFKVLASSLPLIMAEWESRFGEVTIGKQFVVSPEALHSAMVKAEKAMAGAQITDKTDDKPAKLPRKRS